MTREENCGGEATSTVKNYRDSGKYALNKALDGDSSTYWCSVWNNADAKVWWKYKFATAVHVGRIKLSMTYYSSNLGRITILAGNDCNEKVGTLLVNDTSKSFAREEEYDIDGKLFVCYMIQFHLKKADYVAINEAEFFQGRSFQP